MGKAALVLGVEHCMPMKDKMSTNTHSQRVFFDALGYVFILFHFKIAGPVKAQHSISL